MGGEEGLQRLEMEQTVAAPGEPTDGAEMVIGIQVQFRHRAPGADVQNVGLPRLDLGDQRGQARLVAVVDVHPRNTVGAGQDLR